MCGISGIINQDKSEVSRSDIKRMNDLIIHRGPNSEGYFFDKNLALAHRQLFNIALWEERFNIKGLK